MPHRELEFVYDVDEWTRGLQMIIPWKVSAEMQMSTLCTAVRSISTGFRATKGELLRRTFGMRRRGMLRIIRSQKYSRNPFLHETRSCVVIALLALLNSRSRSDEDVCVPPRQ